MRGNDMKKAALRGAVVFAWCVAAPFAQQQPAPTPEAAPAHKVFVLTGCLEAGGGATAAFKLTDASPIGQSIPAPAAGAGGVGTSGQKAAYELQPVSGLDAKGMDAAALRAHAGQRVEVTLRPIDIAPAAAPSAGNPAVQGAKPVDPAPERFSVSAIKRVTGSCS
jgi:hypothetical protein